MEKLAAEAERDSIKFKQVEYMSQFVGEKFKGMISGVTDWGIFVELNENKCEGMVSVRDMKDDYYFFEEENFRYVGRSSGKVFALGDAVWIEVRKADIYKRRLDFVFVREPGDKKESGKKIVHHEEGKKNYTIEDEFDFDKAPPEKSIHSREGKFSETNEEFSNKKSGGDKKRSREEKGNKRGENKFSSRDKGGNKKGRR
jgi:DNA-directed RNA polymerase subunit E'/Rpb7